MKNIIAVCIETVHTYSLVKNIINSDKSLFLSKQAIVAILVIINHKVRFLYVSFLLYDFTNIRKGEERC